MNGRRLELAEIESSLVAENVHVSVSLRVNDKTKTFELIAFHSRTAKVLSADEKVFTTTDVETSRKLEALAKQKLPNFMAPRKYQAVSTIPLSQNGKIDSKALLCACLEPQPSEATTTDAKECQKRLEHLPTQTLLNSLVH